MKIHRWEDVKRLKLSEKQIANIRRDIEKEVLEMNLRTMREALGKTQEALATAAQMDQSEISKAERRNDHLLSTLRRYVEAMGGELEVVAHFGDKRIRLQGV